eukprot:gene22547-biopygen31211
MSAKEMLQKALANHNHVTMSAKEMLHNPLGDPVLHNISRISPTSDLADKCIGARELKALAGQAGKNGKLWVNTTYASAIYNLVALLSPEIPHDIQEDVAGALACLTSHGPDIQGMMGAAGAIPPLVALLSASTAAGVQETVGVNAMAAVALANLVANNTANQVKLISAGAIPHLVALLSANTPAGVQEMAARAPSNLVTNTTGNEVKVASAAATPPLVASSSASRPAICVQKTAALALSNLVCSSPQNQGKVAAAGAIPPLVALLSTSTSECPQEQAANALVNLIDDHHDNQAKMVSVGRIPLLVELLSAQPDLQGHILKSLKQIAACNTDNRKLVVAADAISPLVGLMTNPCATAYVFSGASSIIKALLSDPLVRVMLTSARSFLPLVGLLQVDFPGGMLGWIGTILSHLASTSHSIRRELAAAGIILPLLAVRAASSTPREVQECLDKLHLDLRDVCSCPHCVSKRKCMSGQTTSSPGSSTSVLKSPGDTTSVAEPVDPDKLMQELLDEEEREKAMKEAKAKAKKGKKQRQKEKKKGKGKSEEEQMAVDQGLEGGVKDAEKNLMQQQPAREGGASGGSGGVEPSGGDDDDELMCIVCLDRERDVFLQPCGHVILCSLCCDEVLAKSSLCPVCRAQVLEHVVIE